MPGIFDARRAVIDGDGIEGGFRGAHHDAGDAAGEAVWAVAAEDVVEDRHGAAARNGADERKGDDLAGQAEQLSDRFEGKGEQIEAARWP